MALEIEKKYRVSKERFGNIGIYLAENAQLLRAREFELNSLYSNPKLRAEDALIRLRVTDSYSTLTYKRSIKSESRFKEHLEYESRVGEPEEVSSMLEALDLALVLEYEKYRTTFLLNECEIVLDELPFGLYVEIEGAKAKISESEIQLSLREEEAEAKSYPRIVSENRADNDGVFRAKF